MFDYPCPVPAHSQQRCRVLLDTNVWSNLVRENQVESLRKVAKANHVDIVASPAVVYELLRTPNAEYRKRDLKAVTLSSWLRPMSELYQLAEELRSEITRLRPEWLRNPPDLASWYAQRADWTSSIGFWQRARHQPDLVHQVIATLEEDQIGKARLIAKANRESMPLEFAELDLSLSTSVFLERYKGWNGDPFESWRREAIQMWMEGLFITSRTVYREWLEPWVDLTKIKRDRPSWIKFWVYEVDRDRMPLHWLAWAFSTVTATRKVTTGTPVDCQIGLYLPACEYFATSDRVFGEIVDKVRRWSPVGLGEVNVLPVGQEGASNLIEFLGSVGNNSAHSPKAT
jgi:hypothetical protein